jgi:hypoxanthine phosphoribosyltransferase
MKPEQTVVSSYLESAFDDQRRMVRHIAKTIKGSKLKFDTIAFRGMSGCLVAPTLAYVLNKYMIMIRKDNEKSHSSFKVEGNVNARRVLIVDDFVSTGETVQIIIDMIRTYVTESCGRTADAPPVQLVGVACYRGHYSAYTQNFWLDDHDQKIKLPVWGIAEPEDSDSEPYPMELIEPVITTSTTGERGLTD